MVTLTIDGKEVSVSRTATIYEAAKEAGVYIPVLCYAKKLLPYGACRVCLVEVEQMKGRLIPSCTTPVTQGMVVHTGTAEIRKVRKTVLEFLLVNHVIECPVCDKGGECDLQDLTYEYEVVTNRFEGVKFAHPTDEVNPLIERNMNRCVLCGKCVRVCDEIVGYGSYSFIERGFDSKIATAFDRGLNCEFCGQCVSMCPVGAILPRPFKFKARPWQLEEVDSVCGYCGNGCTVTMGVLNDKVETIRFNDKTGVNDGNLCVRGRFGYSYVNSPDRLTKPLVRKDGALVESSWDEALEAVSNGLRQAQQAKGVGILSGARLTNEEFFLLKDVAARLGTGNIDHSGGECYKVSTEGVNSVLGVKASTATFPQVENCDFILSVRADLYETHPVLGMVVNQAVRRHDARLLVLGDKKAKFSKLPGAKTLLAPPGMEVNLLNAFCNVLIEEGLARTEGVENLEGFKASLAGSTPEATEKATGVSAESIKAQARAMAEAKNCAILLSYGMPYGARSAELGAAAANLALLLGAAGREGSGLYLCGEKANSQGAIDLGFVPAAGALGAKAMLAAASASDLSALYVVGEDLLASYPDRDSVEKALKATGFLVVQDLFLTETAKLADVVLPAVSFAEKEGTFTNAERRIQRLRRAVSSPGEARADLEIFRQLALKLGRPVTYTGVGALTSEVARSVPGYAGLTPDQIGPQGHVWGGETLAVTKKTLVAVGNATAPGAKFSLVTGSTLHHSGTLSVKAKGPISVCPEPFVELSRKDASELGIAEGDLVSISSDGIRLSLKAKVDIRLPEGVLFVPYHFPEAMLNRLYRGQASVAVEISKA